MEDFADTPKPLLSNAACTH